MSQTKIQLSISVSDGSFESVLSLPVESTEQQRMDFTSMWMQQVMMALSINAKRASTEKQP